MRYTIDDELLARLPGRGKEMQGISLARHAAEAKTEDDAALVAAARRDPAAFAVLYRRYVTPVYRYLYSRVGNATDAEETHQGITLRVLAVAHGPEETAV